MYGPNKKVLANQGVYSCHVQAVFIYIKMQSGFELSDSATEQSFTSVNVKMIGARKLVVLDKLMLEPRKIKSPAYLLLK